GDTGGEPAGDGGGEAGPGRGDAAGGLGGPGRADLGDRPRASRATHVATTHFRRMSRGRWGLIVSLAAALLVLVEAHAEALAGRPELPRIKVETNPVPP